MPFIHVTLIEGRTPEKKEQLIAALTQTVHEVIDAPIESVRVCLQEVPAAHWGIAGQSVKKRKANQK
ncbi:4-oxalocrotonate tautomerase [Caryophanon latum]|uniref:Tautomerase n=1 Tax=Caryophanon latum TaxID=33977 RepID=A0A1C0YTZ3_9BACL|nr:4-oxalocrotonate tautomerase [Caryophanon latum]OCS90635.1 4-oxalocrotonate tautomerase [Caryophanon latum]